MPTGKRLTREDYEALAKARGFEWLGPELQNASAKTMWRCQNGHMWESRHNDIQQGHGCPRCAGKARRTPEDYRALARSKGFEWLGPEVENTTTKTKARWRCLHGHEWGARYYSINSGHGCPHCAGVVRKTPVDYRALAQSIGFEWLGPEVQNVIAKTMWRCQNGHVWESRYNDIQQGLGCPHCAGLAKKQASDYHALAQSRGFEWVGGGFPSVMTKTRWRCRVGHEWEATYDGIRRGSGCPLCARIASESAGEKGIAACLIRLGISHEREKRFRQCKGTSGYSFPFDFCFQYDGRVFLVEYDGKQHHEPMDYFGGEEAFRLLQEHDAVKTKFAADNGYILIRIPYTVEQIETYLIQAIADAVGKPFEAVAFPAPTHKTANWRQLSEAPAVGIQIPLV